MLRCVFNASRVILCLSVLVVGCAKAVTPTPSSTNSDGDDVAPNPTASQEETKSGYSLTLELTDISPDAKIGPK